MWGLNYYKCLQIDPDAEHDMIEIAYKKLSQKYHPDVNKSQRAHEMMCLINEAYQTLSKPDRRQRYNMLLKSSHIAPTMGKRHFEQMANVYAKALDLSYTQVIKYFSALKNKQYHQAYLCINPTHYDSISEEQFKKWQHLISKIYSIEEYHVTPRSVEFDVIYGAVRHECVVTYEVIVGEYNKIMDQFEEAKVYKSIVVDNHQTSVLLDQLELYEVMRRYEKLAQIKKNRYYLSSKMQYKLFTKEKKQFLQFLDLEVERYARYKMPFTLIYYKLVVRTAETSRETASFFQSVLKKNVRRLDKVYMIDYESYLVVLTGTSLEEGKRFSEKMAEKVSASFSSLQKSFKLQQVILENEYNTLEELWDTVEKDMLEVQMT